MSQLFDVPMAMVMAYNHDLLKESSGYESDDSLLARWETWKANGKKFPEKGSGEKGAGSSSASKSSSTSGSVSRLEDESIWKKCEQLLNLDHIQHDKKRAQEALRKGQVPSQPVTPQASEKVVKDMKEGKKGKNGKGKGKEDSKGKQAVEKPAKPDGMSNPDVKGKEIVFDKYKNGKTKILALVKGYPESHPQLNSKQLKKNDKEVLTAPFPAITYIQLHFPAFSCISLQFDMCFLFFPNFVHIEFRPYLQS